MNTRQKIIKLFKEKKSPEEIIELLKDEKVSNIRSYVSRVKKDLQDNVVIAKNKERINKRLRRAGIKRRNFVTCKCINCKEEYEIHTNNKEMYNLKVVKENWVCVKCMGKLSRVLIKLICKCKATFQIKVLEKNKDKYKDFKCVKCLDL